MFTSRTVARGNRTRVERRRASPDRISSTRSSRPDVRYRAFSFRTGGRSPSTLRSDHRRCRWRQSAGLAAPTDAAVEVVARKRPPEAIFDLLRLFGIEPLVNQRLRSATLLFQACVPRQNLPG